MLQFMRDEKTYVTIQQRGLIALPADIRRRLGIDQPGAQVEVVERDDGVIELHPTVPVPADQAWFWTQRWQKMERRSMPTLRRVRAPSTTPPRSSSPTSTALSPCAT